MSANPEPRDEARERHYYRRRLSGPELLPALAIGVGAGLVGFYVARLLAQRTSSLDEATSGMASRRLPRAAGEVG